MCLTQGFLEFLKESYFYLFVLYNIESQKEEYVRLAYARVMYNIKQ